MNFVQTCDVFLVEEMRQKYLQVDTLFSGDAIAHMQEAMANIFKEYAPEEGHARADALFCAFIQGFPGGDEVVKYFLEMQRWYS